MHPPNQAVRVVLREITTARKLLLPSSCLMPKDLN